ncbi:MAG: hypothetical protein QOE05_796 [Actinomycetota bacterium]|nr:hypothetical protein [Actinomycetota bacterium]
MTPRTLLPVLASALLLAGCGGSSAPAASKADSTPSAATSAATGTSPSAPAPGGSAAANTSGGAPAGTSGAGTSSSTTGTTTTGTATNNGGNAPAFTAPGSYTYDSSGTVAAGASKRDASGTATFTVDPPAGGRQHTLLGTDQGRTEQDVVVRSTGTFLVRLAITNPTFSKEFRFATPGLLVPDPATIGKTWSWTTKSTDGKTTAAVTARITGRETLTIGGEQTPTTVIESTLKLTGDITYTAHMQNWADLTHRLSVKDHTKGEGMFGAVQFTTDITNVIRSTKPS